MAQLFPRDPISDGEYREILARLLELHAEQARVVGRELGGEGEVEDERELGKECEGQTGGDGPDRVEISAAADAEAEDNERRGAARGKIPKRTAKEEGELAEQAFAWVAGKNGVKTARPEGESLPFDRITIARVAGGYKLCTVQVKCTSTHENQVYKLKIERARNRRYEAGDFDFLAVLIVPEDVWYVIPFEGLRGRSNIYLRPRARGKPATGNCEEWRGRWELLR